MYVIIICMENVPWAYVDQFKVPNITISKPGFRSPIQFRIGFLT